MIDITRRTAPNFSGLSSRANAIVSVAVILILPLLMLFPTLAGWFAGILTLIGLASLIHRRDICPMDWHFVAICLILPVAQLWNMTVMGWAPGGFVSPEKEKLMKLLLGLGGFTCGFTASLLSGTRGGWPAIPFLVALCFFFNDHLSRRSKGIALLVIAVVILAMFAGSRRVRDRIALRYVLREGPTTTHAASIRQL
ncbi:MAG TPA: hypothetical protein VHL60_00820 [Oxalicibacterium sp.]|jgi:hypothetical protein|nr:hypothetical protein [Oxalicibacterium sp.]